MKKSFTVTKLLQFVIQFRQNHLPTTSFAGMQVDCSFSRICSLVISQARKCSINSEYHVQVSCISSNPDKLVGFQQLMESLMALEQLHQYRTLALQSESWFQVSDGTLPVLVSAPHACMHNRDGLMKLEEEFTGAIARYLSMSTSCYSIYGVYQAVEDPNWHTDSEYKRAITQLHKEVGFKFVIDLHGMLNSHGMGVALGTICLLYTSPSPRDQRGTRMPSSA